jgi:(methylthio)acryloyl-CoA hydratase
VPKGQSLQRAIQLAEQMAEHSELSNYAIVTSITRINDMSTTDGLFAESLMAGIVQTNPELRERLGAFLAKKTPRIEPK